MGNASSHMDVESFLMVIIANLYCSMADPIDYTDMQRSVSRTDSMARCRQHLSGSTYPGSSLEKEKRPSADQLPQSHTAEMKSLLPSLWLRAQWFTSSFHLLCHFKSFCISRQETANQNLFMCKLPQQLS